jgi:hypothetical protein
MSMANTKVLSRGTNGVLYADPVNPGFTARFKTSVTQKVIDGIRMDNYATEIIVNESHLATIGDEQFSDPLSIRIRVSGAAVSMPRLKTVLASIAGQLSDWGDEDVLLGFEPVTVPVNPASA